MKIYPFRRLHLQPIGRKRRAHGRGHGLHPDGERPLCGGKFVWDLDGEHYLTWHKSHPDSFKLNEGDCKKCIKVAERLMSEKK